MKFKERSLADYLSRGNSQQSVADAINVHQSCVSGWLRSDRDVRVRKYRNGEIAVFETKKLGSR